MKLSVMLLVAFMIIKLALFVSIYPQPQTEFKSAAAFAQTH